jgi:hypothetical protein
MSVDLQSESYLFEYGVCLVATSFFGLLRGLVLEFPEVHNLGNGRLRVRGNLDEIEISIRREAQCMLNRHDTNLFATGPYQSHLGDADFVIRTGIADRRLL